MNENKEVPTILDVIGATVEQILGIVGIKFNETKEQQPVIDDIPKPKEEIKLKGKSISYQVYLILPENNTIHTNVKRFEFKEKVYYKLDYNGRIYEDSEIENIGEKKDWINDDDGRLTKNACNFLFLSKDNKLSVGKAKFTEKAEKIIRVRERDKLHDRAFENTHYKIHEKYTIIDNNSLMIPTIILVIAIGLLLFFAIPKVIDVMNTVNGHALKDYAEKARIDAFEYTFIINETSNGTVIERT